jgi:hypothetical protein
MEAMGISHASVVSIATFSWDLFDMSETRPPEISQSFRVLSLEVVARRQVFGENEQQVTNLQRRGKNYY